MWHIVTWAVVGNVRGRGAMLGDMTVYLVCSIQELKVKLYVIYKSNNGQI